MCIVCLCRILACRHPVPHSTGRGEKTTWVLVLTFYLETGSPVCYCIPQASWPASTWGCSCVLTTCHCSTAVTDTHYLVSFGRILGIQTLVLTLVQQELSSPTEPPLPLHQPKNYIFRIITGNASYHIEWLFTFFVVCGKSSQSHTYSQKVIRPTQEYSSVDGVFAEHTQIPTFHPQYSINLDMVLHL